MGFYRGPHIVTDGLVLSLDAGNTKSYQSGSITWFDRSGFGTNGTLTNGVGYTGPYNVNGGNLIFDGSDDYVSTGKQLFAGRSEFTWQAFVKFNALQPNAAGPYYQLVIEEDALWIAQYANAVGIDLRQTSSNSWFDNNGGTVTGAQIGVGQLNTSSWFNFAWSWSSSNNQVKGYLNGVLVNTTNTGRTGTIINNSNNTFLFTRNGSQYFNGNSGSVMIYNRALTPTEVFQNYNATKSRFNFDQTNFGSLSNPLPSPVFAQNNNFPAGSYYFRSGSMSSPLLLEYQPSYYESKPFCCVFRSPYRSTATTNRIDLNIPMGGLLVQRDTLDLRAAVYWSTPITYNSVGGVGGNNTADSGYSPRRVMLGGSGAHGIYATNQNQCSWGTATGAIGAGWDGGTCGSFPNDLVWGTGRSDTATYENRSGIWSHWITWS
jgi:hypothetical protein